MRLLILLVAAVTALAAPGEWLVRVDRTGGDAVVVQQTGLSVLDEFEGWILARGPAGVIAAASSRLPITPLAADATDQLLYYVTLHNRCTPQQLARHGRILTRDDKGLLLATTEQQLLALNSLPVSLCRISSTPMVTGAGSGPIAAPAVDDSLVSALVNRVSSDSILANINRLVAFYTRYSTTDSCRRAMDWMRSRFAGYGCDSTWLETFRSTYAPNVIGIKRGRVNPRRIYIICGHVDNTSDVPPNHCPGSDDNASGSSAVLEAARVLQDVSFDYSVWFIGFAGEEQGLYGSDSFATRAYRRGDSIIAVLNFDMISYGRQNIDTFEVIGKNTNPNCVWLVDSFIANARTYTSLKTRRSIVTSAPYSDHHSFWRKGYVAFCGIERDFTPMYHTLGDTVGPLYYVNCGTNNVPMATEAIRAAVATIAKLAGAQLPTGIAEPARPARPARLTAVTPAPGRPPLKISFSSPARTGALVTIYDATGRAVRSLAADNRRELLWDGQTESGARVQAGIYLVRLADGEQTTTAKAIITD